MLCARPVTLKEGFSVPCGDCFNCRINKKRFWTGRILAEMAYTEHTSFWGLSYAPEHVPSVKSGPFAGALTLNVSDARNFIKRWRILRDRDPLYKKEGFRFFLVGEYGDQGFRPHYHVVAFGPRLDVRLEDRVRRAWSVRNDKGELELIGRVDVQPMEIRHAAYCAGYTLKKLTKENDFRLLDGQRPEFFRVSRKPPLGAALFEDIARSTYTRSGTIALGETGDVPNEFRYESRRYPLGRYWITKLREELGVEPTKKTNEERYPDYAERLREAKRKEAKNRRQAFSRGALQNPVSAYERATGRSVSEVRPAVVIDWKGKT